MHLQTADTPAQDSLDRGASDELTPLPSSTLHREAVVTDPDISPRAMPNNKHGYQPLKTPLEIMETTSDACNGGALRAGGAPALTSRETLGLLAQYAAVGLIYSILPGTIYPFFQNYLNVEGSQTVAARTLVSIPWSFKVFYGIVTDCFPIYGYRRRPYMLLGWSLCLSMLVVMALTPIGDPYYTDPSVRYIKPEDYKDPDRASLNPEAQERGGKFVVMMMMASVGYLMAVVASDAVVVEFAQREPEAIRGRTQTAIYTVRTVFMVVGNIVTALIFNGVEYGGDFSFTLSFPQVMLLLAICIAPILPLTWLFIQETQFQAPGFTSYVRELWTVLQTRAVYQVIAYKFFSGLFENVTFVARDPMQTYWATVSPLNEKLGQIFMLGVMALTLVFTGNYGLSWNWRVVAIVTMLSTVALDAICTLFVTWNIVRNEWFWIAIPAIEYLPMGVGFIVSTYVIVELAEMGHEGAIYGLLTTVSNLSDPFAKTISKHMNAPLHITNTAIQNDTHDIRIKITITILIMYGIKVLSLAWLPLLPPQKKATQVLRAKGETSRTMGILTAMYIFFAMVWSVTTNLMSMFPSTSCLWIAGGVGCQSNKS